MDGRRTPFPRILSVRLYHCSNGHQVETAETIVGDVDTIARKKRLINTHTMKAGIYSCKKTNDDYRL